MNEELEGAKAKLIKDFPEAEDRIKAVDCVDKLKALRVELEAESGKEPSFEEKIEALRKQYHAEVKAGLHDLTVKETGKKTVKENQVEGKRFADAEKEISNLKARLAEANRVAEKIPILEARLVKMEDETVIKGQSETGTEKAPFNFIEEAMSVDLKRDPMALQKLGRRLLEKE